MGHGTRGSVLLSSWPKLLHLLLLLLLPLLFTNFVSTHTHFQRGRMTHGPPVLAPLLCAPRLCIRDQPVYSAPLAISYVLANCQLPTDYSSDYRPPTTNCRQHAMQPQRDACERALANATAAVQCPSPRRFGEAGLT